MADEAEESVECGLSGFGDQQTETLPAEVGNTSETSPALDSPSDSLHSRAFDKIEHIALGAVAMA